MRFRRSIKVAPGLKLNVNKKSVSLTAGKRGAHVTVNTKGQRTTSVGAPGTGLSYRSTKKIASRSGHANSGSAARTSPARRQATSPRHPVVLWLALLPLGFGCWAPLYGASKVNRPAARLTALGAVALFIGGVLCLALSPTHKTSTLGTIAIALWFASWIVSVAVWLVIRSDYREARAQATVRNAGVQAGIPTGTPASGEPRPAHPRRASGNAGTFSGAHLDPTTFESPRDEVKRDVPRTPVDRDVLIDSRPIAWEYRVFASDLFLEMQRLEPSWRDFRDRLGSGDLTYLNRSEAREFVLLVLKGAGESVGALELGNDPAAQERAFGRPGEPGDPAEIERFARMITGRYAELLNTARSIREHVVPDEYDEPFELLVQLIAGPMMQIRAFVATLVSNLDNIESRLSDRDSASQPLTIDATLAVSLDPHLLARLKNSIRRPPSS
jgi:hypothetical protein